MRFKPNTSTFYLKRTYVLLQTQGGSPGKRHARPAALPACSTAGRSRVPSRPSSQQKSPYPANRSKQYLPPESYRNVWLPISGNGCDIVFPTFRQKNAATVQCPAVCSVRPSPCPKNVQTSEWHSPAVLYGQASEDSRCCSP